LQAGLQRPCGCFAGHRRKFVLKMPSDISTSLAAIKGANDASKTAERVIRPQRGLVAVNFAELWRYRELFGFLTWRDILLRYKQTVLGLAWSIIRPFLTMIVLTVIFGGIAKLPSQGIPYPILVYAGMLPWQFF